MKPFMFCRLALAALALVSGAGNAALAGKADDTLNVVMLRETDFVDRLHTNSRESQIFSTLIYDTLLYMNPIDSKFSGLLAKSWKWVDDTTVEFELRDGVRFHNDETFDADDVVQTIAVVTNPENKLRQQQADFGNLAAAEKLGSHKVRLRLKKPDALADFLLANRLIMWPNEYTQANGRQVHASKPVGTGPYSMRSLQPGKAYALARNDGYFAGPRLKAAIGAISVRVIGDVQTQIAELTVGRENLSFDIPAELAEESLKSNPKVRIAYGGTTRYTFLSLDAAGRSDAKPLTDRRVRQAIAHAIDRPTIAKHLAGGGAQPLNAQCNPAQEMCFQDVPGQAYDPARARALLAEAGYAQGFDVSLMSSTDLKTIGEAIQGYLSAIGIRAKYETFTLPAWRSKFLKGESAMSVLGWGGSGSFSTDYALRIFYNQAEADYARDKDITALMNQAAGTVDKATRTKLYRDLLTRINASAYTVPLFANGAVYVMSADLDFTPPRLDSPDLTWARWK